MYSVPLLQKHWGASESTLRVPEKHIIWHSACSGALGSFGKDQCSCSEKLRHWIMTSERCYMLLMDCWLDTPGPLAARATVVPVICTSEKTHLTNYSSNQHVWPLYFMIGNIWQDIRHTPNKCTYFLVGLIPCPIEGSKNMDEVCHSTVGTVLFQLWNLDLTSSGLVCNCAKGFQRECYPRLATWVGDYLEHVMMAEVSYGSGPMCEIPNGAALGHSTCHVLNKSKDYRVQSAHLDETNIYILHTVHVHSICNLFWQFALRNIYQLGQPDALLQLLLGFVKGL